MNLSKLFEMQRKLDERIIEEKGLYGQDLLTIFLNLGFELGFTPEQIEQAYLQKNAENHRRQAEGY